MNPACDWFLARLLESLDEPLPAADQPRFDAHVAECRSCAAALREHVILHATLAEIDQAPMAAPSPLSEDLVRRCVSAMKTAAAGRAEPGAAGGARTA